MQFGRITGWGTALPERIVTNDELAQMVDTSDEWIRTRSGISARHWGGSTGEMSIEAGRAAMECAGVQPGDIDLLILATTTPDQRCPATASPVQEALGLQCGAMDLNAACSGFVYGYVTAQQFVTGGVERVLVIGADALTQITDMTDRSTMVLFADGAGAAVIERTSDTPTLLGWDLGSDGSAADLLYADHGGLLHMNGKEVFRKAVLAMENAALRAFKQAGVNAEDIKLVVPHQANIRIIETAMKRLDIEMEKAAVVLHRTGNTSSASVPLALVDAIDNDRLERDDLILMVGFGAGMSSAAAVVRWDP